MEQSVVVEQENNPQLKPKTHFKGKILKTNLAGALVDIGMDRPGVLHISRIIKTNNTPVHKTEDVLKEGQEINVWVKRVNNQRVELTMVEPLLYDWRDLKKEMKVTGKVVKFEKFGAFIEIGAERPALVHISEMAHGYVRKPDDIIKLGEEIEAQIIDVDRKKRQIKLSIKSLLPEPQSEEIVFEGYDKKEKTINKKRAIRRDHHDEEKVSANDIEMKPLEQTEPEHTAMEIALKQAMDKAKQIKEDQRIKKVKPLSKEQEDILTRTLGNKVQTN
jgi:small subunit ribosomal protein S1